MRFSCESCGAQYMISDEKVGPNGVRVRCKKCDNIVSVKRPPAVAPEVAPEPPPAAAPDASAEGGHESSLERELGDAFESVFGGGSAGLAAEAQAAAESGLFDSPEPPAPEPPAGAPDRVASADAVDDWYVAIDDSQVGPLPAPGVKARWEAGEIGPDTLAWRPGMADWVPLSTISEMAQYLAPVPLGSAKVSTGSAASAPAAAQTAAAAAPAPAEDEHPAPAAAANGASHAAPGGASYGSINGAVNGALNGHDISWKPSAASALAALASEELASAQQPEPRTPGSSVEVKGGSLLDRMDLPDGGVDPTNVLPLPIKGLDPTGEAPLKPKPAPVAPERTDIRQIKKSARRSVLAIGIAMAVLFAGGIAVVVWMLRPVREAPVAHALPAAPAAAPAPPASPPSVAPPAVSPPTAVAEQIPGAPAPGTASPAAAAAPAVAAAPPPSAPAAAAPPVAKAAPPPAPPPEPARAAQPAEREPAHAAASRAQHRAKPEPPPAPPPTRAGKRGSRVAAVERAPPPPVEQPRKKASGDPLLDVGGDDEVEKELTGKGSRRSVYVPPAIGSDLPESVSVSQINEAVVGQKAGLVRCIDQQKAADPDTRGTLKVRWIISGDGSVRDVRIVSEEFARQPIAPCISGVVRGIRFPRSRTSGQEVVFPFKF